MERIVFGNRNGPSVETEASRENWLTVREAALSMTESRRGGTAARNARREWTRAMTREFVVKCRRRGICPHVAAKARHGSTDRLTLVGEGYAIGRRKRKRVNAP